MPALSYGRSELEPFPHGLSQQRTIVLISPRAEPDWPHPEKLQGLPLGCLTVARPLVARGHDVRIVDENVLARAIDAFHEIDRPLWIGFSVIGGYTLVAGMALAKKLRRKYPGVPFVWGGWNPTLMSHLYEDETSASIVDIVVRGRGEQPAVDITDRLIEGRSLADVPGISWREPSGKMVRNSDGSLEPIGSSGALPYHLIEDPSRYILRFGAINFISSYGCPHRCGFCGIPVGTRTFRPMDNVVVVEELARIKKDLRVRSVVFLDDNFFTQKGRVIDLAERMIAAGLELAWHSNGRLDQVGPLSDEELALLVRSGCRSINVGYETGSQEVADAVDKDIRVEDIYAVADKFSRVGLRLSINFMVGLPGETPQSLIESLETLRAIHARHRDLEVCWYIYMPAPGTPLWQKLVDEGKLFEPRTLAEHARFQSLDLEHPWYYKSPDASIFLEWRNEHKAISFYFHAAFSPDNTVEWLRNSALRRWHRRDFGRPFEWRLFLAVDRVKRSVRTMLSRIGRTRLFSRGSDARRMKKIESVDGSFVLVTGIHRGT